MTTVSLDVDCGSTGSLVWVAVEMVVEVSASSFILALVLVGGMCNGRSCQGPGRAVVNRRFPAQRGKRVDGYGSGISPLGGAGSPNGD